MVFDPQVLGGALQPCGTCRHPHQMAEGVPLSEVGSLLFNIPACARCGCRDYTVSPDVVAAMDAAAAEHARTDGTVVLPSDVAAGLHSTLRGFEAETFVRFGFEHPPIFGITVAAGRRYDQDEPLPGLPVGMTAPENVGLLGLLINPLRVPLGEAAAGVGVQPGAALLACARRGEKDPAWFDRFRGSAAIPDSGVIAWWSLSAMDVVIDGRARGAVRELLAVDIDERFHTVCRGSKDGEVRTQMFSRADYQRAAAPMLRAEMMPAGPGGVLPDVAEGLLRCMRLCSADAMLRAAFDEQDAG